MAAGWGRAARPALQLLDVAARMALVRSHVPRGACRQRTTRLCGRGPASVAADANGCHPIVGCSAATCQKHLEPRGCSSRHAQHDT
eukprot:scaffold3068_cov401-Prasinococcus_capsulatus_cf.AAC.61